MPLISVVMSVYNEEPQYLKESIYSILNQTYKKIEFIIVLDNPFNEVLKDILIKIQEKDKRIKLIINDKNEGLTSSLNTAMLVAKGNYIARMDADDISINNRLEIQVNYLENNKNIDLVGTDIEYINKYGNKMNRKSILIEKCCSINRRLKYCNCFNHPTWMFRKKVLEKLVNYREIPCAEDYDFIIRLVLSGFKCCNINTKLLLYRVREDGISQSNVLQQERVTYLLANGFKKKEITNIESVKKIIPNEYENQEYDKFKKYINKFKEKKYSVVGNIMWLYVVNKDVRMNINMKIKLHFLSINDI